MSAFIDVLVPSLANLVADLMELVGLSAFVGLIILLVPLAKAAGVG